MSLSDGYQSLDKNFIDYEQWNPADFKFSLRGPAFDHENEIYFSAIGAAQTFGRFVHVPYTKMIADDFNIKCLNLGTAGAGPSYFSNSPKAIDLINKSKFCIIQILSGRSVANSLFTLGVNQGTLTNNELQSQNWELSENAYRKILQTKDDIFLSALKAETRLNYIFEMILLLKMIKVPKILFYFSERKVDYKENNADIGGYFGAFPHFINGKIIGVIKNYADEYIEAISRKGLPQPIFNKQGEPELIWNEKDFPNVKYRYHNNYYPSPEMHEIAYHCLINTLKKYK